MTNIISDTLAAFANMIDDDPALSPLQESNKKLVAVVRKRYGLTLHQARAMVGAVDKVFADANVTVKLTDAA